MAARLPRRNALPAFWSALLLAAMFPSAVAANEPPWVSIKGPAFVPVSSASTRTYFAGADDRDSATWTRDLECGSEAPVASGPWMINGYEWFNCSFDTPGTHVVGVRAGDAEGAQTASVQEVIATTRVRSVADAHVVAIGRDPHRAFGGNLAFVDLNGDGKAELASAVGDPRGSGVPSSALHVHVLFGRTSGGTVYDDDYSGTTGFKISGTADEHYFGTSLANAGDVNRDGYKDIIIGSPAGEGLEARAYVIFGRPNIGDLTPATMTAAQGFRISAPGMGFNIEVAGGGDINGDGYSDVVVGTPDTSPAAHVIYGKARPGNVDLSAGPSTYGARLAGGGRSIALGDVSGDQNTDVVLGTRGNVHVVLGRSTLGGTVDVGNMVPSVGFTISDTESSANDPVATGRLNGEGKAEIIFAGPRSDGPYDGRSRVSILLGAALHNSFSLYSPPPGKVFEILMPRDGGIDTLAAADWNGDRKAELLIGGWTADEHRGSAYIVPGQADLVDMRLEVLGSWHRVDGDHMGARAGEGLAAGDFNGDRRPDVAVGAPWTNTEDPVSMGRVGIFLGTGNSANDTQPPVAFAPAPSLVARSLLTSNPTVRIMWPAATDNVDVAKYKLQRKVNSGTWENVALDSPRTLTADVALAAGSNVYRFRVRAIDGAGNVSTWKAGPAFEVRTLQEDDATINYSGSFTTESVDGASGGSVRWSETAGDTATLTFTGRAIAFVTDRGARGKLRIHLDGEELHPEIDMYYYTFSAAWIQAAYNRPDGSHTLTVEVLGQTNGASGSFRIDIDAFIVLK